jgi:hypothetical protein
LEKEYIMPTYKAYFRSDAEWAWLEIEADTPQQALDQACTVDTHTLLFEGYDDYQPVNHIIIRDSDHEDLAEWRDEELRLRRAAPQMFEALEELLECQKFGIDALAHQVQRKGNAIEKARAAIAKAKGCAA